MEGNDSWVEGNEGVVDRTAESSVIDVERWFGGDGVWDWGGPELFRNRSEGSKGTPCTKRNNQYSHQGNLNEIALRQEPLSAWLYAK